MMERKEEIREIALLSMEWSCPQCGMTNTEDFQVIFNGIRVQCKKCAKVYKIFCNKEITEGKNEGV